MRILFVNASPHKSGHTVKLAQSLLEGQEYETLHLVDYKIYSYGQKYEDDQWQEVIDKLYAADVVVMGSPLYWHNICGQLRNLLDRCYGPIKFGSFSGKQLYFLLQGGAPEPWQLEASDFTMARFAELYGFEYKGMINTLEQAKSAKLG